MRKGSWNNRGFSLAEIIAALTIGAMVLVAVLGIYSRAQNAAAGIRRKLDSSRLPSEVLQRIAEDLDRIIASGGDTKIAFRNKVDRRGYPTAKLSILKTVEDGKGQAKTFEEIVWQTGYDYYSDANGLVLYRSHKGIAVEDKLLDEQREDWESQYSFVPICNGVTFFGVQAAKGEELQDIWTSSSLPPGIVVTISFAEPVETLTGAWEVPDWDKVTRTIAIDRTRKMKFEIVKREYEQEAKGPTEEDAEDKEATQDKKGDRNEKENDQGQP
jgi:prepilin-type N-terminal cleavage/methylation domain-containing protein